MGEAGRCREILPGASAALTARTRASLCRDVADLGNARPASIGDAAADAAKVQGRSMMCYGQRQLLHRNAWRLLAILTLRLHRQPSRAHEGKDLGFTATHFGDGADLPFAGGAWSFYALRCFLVAEAGSARLSPSTWALACSNSIGTASF